MKSSVNPETPAPVVAREDWRPLDWDMCPECGGDDLEARTRCDDGQVQDGDAVRCATCGARGSASVGEDGRAWIVWDDGVPEPAAAPGKTA